MDTTRSKRREGKSGIGHTFSPDCDSGMTLAMTTVRGSDHAIRYRISGRSEDVARCLSANRYFCQLTRQKVTARLG